MATAPPIVPPQVDPHFKRPNRRKTLNPHRAKALRTLAHWAVHKFDGKGLEELGVVPAGEGEQLLDALEGGIEALDDRLTRKAPR